MLTPVSKFEEDGLFVKREDMAAWTGRQYPSGSKVRQYAAMAKETPGAPMIVGCSALSAMQIYVAAAAHQAGVAGIVYVPRRALRSDATRYACEMGAEIHEVHPGYPSVVRSAAKARAAALGRTVRWLRERALLDAKEQAANIPEGVRRVVVATGSGLTAAGVVAGLAGRESIEVVALSVSPMATRDRIWEWARTLIPGGNLDSSPLPPLSLVRAPWRYDYPVVAWLPDGTPLDPFYAAKAWWYLQPGDCLWTPGLRPVCAMPEACREQFKHWAGFGENLLTTSEHTC